MLTLGVVAAGLGLLLIAGAYQLSTAGLTGPEAKRTQLVSEESVTFTRADRRNPRRILDDPGKIRNAVVLVTEVAAISMAVWMAIHVRGMESVPAVYEWLIFAVLAVGALLVGRGAYVRLGLYGPVSTREALRTSVGTSVANDYAAISDALGTARGEGSFDEVTVGVLAGARNGASVAALTDWARTARGTSPDALRDRVDELVDAGLVAVDDGDLRLDGTFDGADPKQVASAATSVLE